MNFLQRYLLASFRALIAIIPLMDSEGVIMNSTRVRASGARSWIIVCALASMMMPLAADGQDWQMSGNDLTNDRNQPHETLIDAGNVATSNRPGPLRRLAVSRRPRWSPAAMSTSPTGVVVYTSSMHVPAR